MAINQTAQPLSGPADAVRYWAAAARLGLDATYDIGQMKVSRGARDYQ